MTLKTSFWARLIYNLKTKLWIWAAGILTMLIAYPSVMLVYLNRVSYQYDLSTPTQVIAFTEEMKEAVCDAIGNTNGLAFVFLAIVFACGLYNYVNNKSKVDAIKSMPIKESILFFADYFTGIIVCFVTYLICLIIAIMIAAGWGYLSSLAIMEALISIITNMLLFIIYYTLAICCIMLTGNVFIGLELEAGITIGLASFVNVLGDMKSPFFKTASVEFGIFNSAFEPFTYYIGDIWYDLKRYNNIPKELELLGPNYIYWTILSILLIALAYRLFLKRPAEANNKAVYSKVVRRVLKLIFVPVFAVVLGYVVLESSSQSHMLMGLAALVCGILLGMIMDVVFESDIKGAFKGIVTTIIGTVIAMSIFCVYQFDLFGYDKFVPTSEKVESYAFAANTNGYSDCIEFMFDTNGKLSKCEWTYNLDFYKENMYLTNVEPLTKLMKKCLDEKLYDTFGRDSIVGFPVYLRMKNGTKKSRTVYCDTDDQETLELLDEIIKTEEWRNGNFQFISAKNIIANNNFELLYQSPFGDKRFRTDISELIEAWTKDSEKITYSRCLKERPVCSIGLKYDSFIFFTIPVFKEYENTLRILTESGCYEALEISSDDIETIKLINYHNEVWEKANIVDEDPTQIEMVTDKETIEKLLEIIEPDVPMKIWEIYNAKDSNYGIEVVFKPDSQFGKRSSYVTFSFSNGVPDWVVNMF